MLSLGGHKEFPGGPGLLVTEIIGEVVLQFYGKKRGLEVIFLGRVRELRGYLEVRIN